MRTLILAALVILATGCSSSGMRNAGNALQAFGQGVNNSGYTQVDDSRQIQMQKLALQEQRRMNSILQQQVFEARNRAILH